MGAYKSEPRYEVVHTRLTTGEYCMLLGHANRKGISISTALRELIMAGLEAEHAACTVYELQTGRRVQESR